MASPSPPESMQTVPLNDWCHCDLALLITLEKTTEVKHHNEGVSNWKGVKSLCARALFHKTIQKTRGRCISSRERELFTVAVSFTHPLRICAS